MPSVPDRPHGPMLRIPEPTDTPRPFWAPGKFHGPAVEQMVDKIVKAKAAAIPKPTKQRAKPKSKAPKPPKPPRVPRIRTAPPGYNNCTWCGDKVLKPAVMHPRCAEAKERITSQK